MFLERDVPVLDPCLLENGADELDARSLIPRRVRRVEPDQSLEQLGRLDPGIHRSDDTSSHQRPLNCRAPASRRTLRPGGVWMSVYEAEWLRHGAPRPAGERRFHLFTLAAATIFVAYVVATVVGAPRDTLSLVSAVVVLPVPFVGWWAYRRAPENLRLTFLLCAWAATLWLVGSLVWYGFFLAEGSEIPPSPGVWDICFVAARLLLIGAVLAAIRSLVSLRLAALDASVIVAAGVAVGAAFIGRGLEDRVTPGTLVTLNRPLLGIVTLILIASAALGSWEGMPRSIALLGLGEVALTIGSLIYSYSAVQGEFTDDRWADLAWTAGAGVSMLAGAVLILGIDRPVLVRSRFASGEGSGLRTVLHLTLGAISFTLGVAAYGFVTARETVAIIGVG